MNRFTFIAALFLGLAACTGCGDDASSNDGSAQVDGDSSNNDAGHDGDSND